MLLSRLILWKAIAAVRPAVAEALLLPVQMKSTGRTYSSGEIDLPRIDYDEFEKHRKAGDATLLDVRNPDELIAEGAIPEALNVPFPRVPEAFDLDKNTFEESFNHVKPGVNDLVIPFCKMGIRAEKAGEMLMLHFGYKNVQVYFGSMDDWKTHQ